MKGGYCNGKFHSEEKKGLIINQTRGIHLRFCNFLTILQNYFSFLCRIFRGCFIVYMCEKAISRATLKEVFSDGVKRYRPLGGGFSENPEPQAETLQNCRSEKSSWLSSILESSSEERFMSERLRFSKPLFGPAYPEGWDSRSTAVLNLPQAFTI